jgi:hypothetical protein
MINGKEKKKKKKTLLFNTMIKEDNFISKRNAVSEIFDVKQKRNGWHV